MIAIWIAIGIVAALGVATVYASPAAPAPAHQMSMREVPPQEGFTEVEDDELPW